MNSYRAKGFTLIEGIIVITIIAVVFVVGAMVLRQGFRSYFLAQSLSQTALQGDIAVERMKRELQSATTFLIANANTCRFIDLAGNTITYTLSGQSLLRNSQVLASSVASLTFSYLTVAGAVTTNPSQVYYVTINLNLARSDGIFNLRTSVFSRNLAG